METIPLFQRTGVVETTWKDLKYFPQRVATGDYIPFTLGDGEEIAVRAMHDDRGKLFFVLEECLCHCIAWSAALTVPTSWATATIRKYLNETVFNKLPKELKSAIEPTELLVDEVVFDDETARYKKIRSATCHDNLFLLSLSQVFGERDKQNQLDWFKDRRHRIKKLNGSPYYWWLLDRKFGPPSVNGVTSSGGADDYLETLSGGVVFGFCLGNKTYTR